MDSLAELPFRRLRAEELARFMSRKTSGYAMDTFLWLRSDEIRDAIDCGPFAHPVTLKRRGVELARLQRTWSKPTDSANT